MFVARHRGTRSRPRSPLPRLGLVDVAAGGERDAGEGERDGPGDQDEPAGGGGEEVVGGEPDECVAGVDGAVAADGGYEREEQVLDDEAPGEQADDRADLAANDRAEADADRAPERGAGDVAEQEQRDLAAVEGEVDAAPLRAA